MPEPCPKQRHSQASGASREIPLLVDAAVALIHVHVAIARVVLQALVGPHAHQRLCVEEYFLEALPPRANSSNFRETLIGLCMKERQIVWVPAESLTLGNVRALLL